MFAGEIASDLSQYHHRRIADWHDGTMNSHEFLELCEFMPDAGRFKTQLRGGEPSEDQWAWRQTANETAVLRMGMIPGSENGDWGSRLFTPTLRTVPEEESEEEWETLYDSIIERNQQGVGDG